MAQQKRKDKPMVLLKSLILAITCMSFFVLSCNNSGSGSTNSGGGGSGTGTGWTITIQVGTNPLPFTGISTTTVMGIVRDGTGAPAPKGTYICMTAVLNGFLIPGTPNDPTKIVKNVCETTTTDLGQSIQTYFAPQAGDDIVEVSSRGVIGHVTIHNN